MTTASEQLVRLTWLAEHQMFAVHDSATPVNWDAVWLAMTETTIFTEHQLVLIAVLEFLCGSDMAEVSLDEVDRLPELDRQAVLQALGIRWSNVETFQEDM